jgi:hypothetical protein
VAEESEDGMNRKQIVVSKYNEDINWVKDLPYNTIVYDKYVNQYYPQNPNVTYKTLRNKPLGREAHTYFYHIVNNYENIADLTVFLQGDPWSHCENLLEYLKLEPSETTPISSINRIGYEKWAMSRGHKMEELPRIMERLKPLNHQLFVANCGSTEFYRWNFIFEGYPPPNSLVYAYGAQYIVPKRRILQHPITFYKRLLNAISDERNAYEIDAWGMEKMFFYLFGEPTLRGFPDALKGITNKCMI